MVNIDLWNPLINIELENGKTTVLCKWNPLIWFIQKRGSAKYIDEEITKDNYVVVQYWKSNNQKKLREDHYTDHRCINGKWVYYDHLIKLC